MTIVCREASATLDDARLIRGIETDADTGFLSPYEGEHEVLVDLSEEGWARILECDGRAVGAIVIARRAGSLSAEIALLAVSKEYQRRGFGRMLLRDALERLGSIPVVELVTRVDNPARKLYESEGFVVQSREEDLYGDGHPRFMMAWRGQRPGP